MQSYWFGDIDSTSCHSFGGDLEELARRARTLRIDMGEYTPLDWERARECGFATDREEYLTKLRDLCILIARERVAAFYRRRDIELIHMVRMLDGMDEATNLLTERALEWYRTQDPFFSLKYRGIPQREVLGMMSAGSGVFRQVTEEIDRIAKTRSELMKEISRVAGEVLPNTSALLGGLVASRLLFQCGGLQKLSALPGSSIQVIGASSALFAHLKNGMPSPKHGIIYQHARVHNTPRNLRGKVARTLSAKVAIAARLDYHRGELVPAFLDEAKEAIQRAGRR